MNRLEKTRIIFSCQMHKFEGKTWQTDPEWKLCSLPFRMQQLVSLLQYHLLWFDWQDLISWDVELAQKLDAPLCKHPCHAVFSVDLSVTSSCDGSFPATPAVCCLLSHWPFRPHPYARALCCVPLHRLCPGAAHGTHSSRLYITSTQLYGGHYSFHVAWNLSPLTLNVGKTFLLLEIVRLVCDRVLLCLFTPHTPLHT